MTLSQPGKFERRLRHLELVALDSMRASVVDFFGRRPPKTKPPWTPEMYPTGSEKELYAEFAHILLCAPQVMIPALLRLFQAPMARQLEGISQSGNWRAYRLSTIRLERGVRWTGPLCFPGAAGHGSIADVGLFLNPSFNGRQVQADAILYFEIKSADHYSHKVSQLEAHLETLEQETEDGVGFLAAVGGCRVQIEHPRWLGHVTLDSFLRGMRQVALTELPETSLAAEIEGLRVRKSC